MAWNPSPRVADCRDIARKWGGQEQVIILAIDGDGRLSMATYGKTVALCKCAKVIGERAWNAVCAKIAEVEAELERRAAQ